MLRESVVSKSRVGDDVYNILRRAIVRHELVPGARLSAPALATDLNVSRSPVREAVQRLIQEGLATEKPRRGAVVTSFSRDELVPLYEVRSSLEGLAARLATENANAKALRRLTRILDIDANAVADDDLEKHLQADIDFHAGVLALSGNPVLQKMLHEIYTKIQLAIYTRVAPIGPRHALTDHQAILRAILSGDPDAAERAARRHVQRVRQRLAPEPPVSSKDLPVWSTP